MLEQLAGLLGVKKAGLVAGFMGALVSLRFVQEATTWPTRIFMALAGTLAAAYLTPGITEYLGASDKIESALAFGIGLFGMTIAGAVVSAVRDAKVAEAITTWFRRPGT